MFGIDYLTVGGYIADGAVVCRDCGEHRGLPTGDSVSVAQLSADWSEGLACDDCLTWIVEPPEGDDSDYIMEG